MNRTILADRLIEIARCLGEESWKHGNNLDQLEYVRSDIRYEMHWLKRAAERSVKSDHQLDILLSAERSDIQRRLDLLREMEQDLLQASLKQERAIQRLAFAVNKTKQQLSAN